MERAESEKANSKLLDAHFVPKISEWLAENVQDMQQKSNEIMKLIEDDQNSSTQEIDDCEQKRPQLLPLVQEFSTMYQSLAEQYNQIVGEPQHENPHQHPDSKGGSPHVTPDRVLQSHKRDQHHLDIDLSLSSGDGSFETSLKEGSESSSLSSDAESEYFTSAMNGYLDTVKQMNSLGQHQKKSKPVTEPISMDLSSEEVDVDGSAKRSEYGSYEELIGRMVQYEEEKKALNLKLQQSEEEVTMLKSALNKSEGTAHVLQVQLEELQIEITKRDANVEEGKSQVLQLERHILEMKIHIADSQSKTEILMKELEQAQKKLKRSVEEVFVLTVGLDSERQKAVELQDSISVYQKDAIDRANEIVRLQTVFSEAERKYCVEKEQLIMESESQCKQWEENLRQLEDEKTELKKLHHALVREMRDLVSNSMGTMEVKDTRIGSLNKELDKLKLRHDMVVAERDRLSAQIQGLVVELSCRDDHIKELTAGTARAEEAAGELKLKVQELEEEVEILNVLISDGAEKKREAIRQLCFSLEHYRTGYHELRDAFRGHKRHSGPSSRAVTGMA